MVINIQDYGKMIKNKVEVHWRCRQAILIQGNGKIVKNMGEECINLVMMIIMRGSLLRE